MSDEVRHSIPDNPLDPSCCPLLSEWRSRVLNLFAAVLSKGNPVLKLATNIDFRFHEEHSFEELFGFLRGVHDDFKSGLFDNLKNRIESEVSVDYLEQAEHLLAEKGSGHYYYIPAAVLAGAVLEKSLRSLCDRNEPPIKTVKPNGQPKAMNALIDDLKKAEVLDEIWSKQLKTWADIRNAAAHGRTEDITLDQVKSMLRGIPTFLRHFMK